MTHIKMQINVLKKLFILLPIFLIATTAITAQTTIDKAEKSRPTAKFHPGDIEFKAGVGVLPTFLGENSKVITLPIQASLSYRINPIVSVGAYAGYSSTLGSVNEYLDGSAYQSQNDFLLLGVRVAAHMIRAENFDFYGGMSVSYNKPFVTTTTISEPNDVHQTAIDDVVNLVPTPFNPNGTKNNVVLGGFLGGAYYFTPKFNVFGEIGYGVSIATVGLGYKF